MADPAPTIRPYVKSEDDKLVRFMIGKAHMDPLASANRKASLHPLSLTSWILVSSVFIQLMGWWPNGNHGIWGYLSPLPSLAASALPIIFLIDWLNRPHFENDTRKVLTQPDVVDTQSYYSRSPASGFWILEYGDRFIGLIAVDASSSSDNDGAHVSKMRTKAISSNASSRRATIRHLYVDQIYRPISMQKDLLSYAVNHVFDTDSIVEGIQATASPLDSYIQHVLVEAGFKVVAKGEKMGVLGWRSLTYEISRCQWASQKQ